MTAHLFLLLALVFAAGAAGALINDLFTSPLAFTKRLEMIETFCVDQISKLEKQLAGLDKPPETQAADSITQYTPKLKAKRRSKSHDQQMPAV